MTRRVRHRHRRISVPLSLLSHVSDVPCTQTLSLSPPPSTALVAPSAPSLGSTQVPVPPPPPGFLWAFGMRKTVRVGVSRSTAKGPIRFSVDGAPVPAFDALRLLTPSNKPKVERPLAAEPLRLVERALYAGPEEVPTPPDAMGLLLELDQLAAQVRKHRGLRR